MFIKVFDKNREPVVIKVSDIQTAHVCITEYVNHDSIDIKVEIKTPFGEFETEGISGIEVPDCIYENRTAIDGISDLYNCALAHTLNNFEKEDMLVESALDFKVDDVLCEIGLELISKLGY